MPSPEQSDLIEKQILKSQDEVSLQVFVFSLTNILSLALLGFIAYRCAFFEYNDKEDYSKFIQAAIGLIAPFLAFAAQGYIYPRKRRIDVLDHLRSKPDLNADDIKCTYEK